jgi:predicted DNA-binding transcriptional regulator AlpA
MGRTQEVEQNMLRDYQHPSLPVEAASTFDENCVGVNNTESPSAGTGRVSETDRRRSPEKLLGAKEVANWLGVSRAWVFEHSNGRRRPFLPSVKLGKSVRYRPVDVDAFIIECERFSRRGAA